MSGYAVTGAHSRIAAIRKRIQVVERSDRVVDGVAVLDLGLISLDINIEPVGRAVRGAAVRKGDAVAGRDKGK